MTGEFWFCICSFSLSCLFGISSVFLLFPLCLFSYLFFSTCCRVLVGFLLDFCLWVGFLLFFFLYLLLCFTLLTKTFAGCVFTWRQVRALSIFVSVSVFLLRLAFLDLEFNSFPWLEQFICRRLKKEDLTFPKAQGTYLHKCQCHLRILWGFL